MQNLTKKLKMKKNNLIILFLFLVGCTKTIPNHVVGEYDLFPYISYIPIINADYIHKDTIMDRIITESAKDLYPTPRNLTIYDLYRNRR